MREVLIWKNQIICVQCPGFHVMWLFLFAMSCIGAVLIAHIDCQVFYVIFVFLFDALLQELLELQDQFENHSEEEEDSEAG